MTNTEPLNESSNQTTADKWMDPYIWQEMTSLVKSILENKNLKSK